MTWVRVQRETLEKAERGIGIGRRARAAIPDRDLQLRLIHMLMGSSKGATSSSTVSPASPSNSSDSNTHKQHASPTRTAAPTATSAVADLVRMPPLLGPSKSGGTPRLTLRSIPC